MISSYEIKRRVLFSDTDASGIMHFSRFFTYMEACEHEMLLSAGQNVLSRDGSCIEGWPRVNAQCDYRQPLALSDEFLVRIMITAIGNSSISYKAEFIKCSDQSVCAQGAMTVVFVSGDLSQGQTAVSSQALTDELRKQLTIDETGTA